MIIVIAAIIIAAIIIPLGYHFSKRYAEEKVHELRDEMGIDEEKNDETADRNNLWL